MASTRPASRLLTLGALGVVFGDIGTSPLYALRTVFAAENHIVTVTLEQRVPRRVQDGREEDRGGDGDGGPPRVSPGRRSRR